MISNELYNGQGLGNQLWNYVVARIIAKKNGTDFFIIGSERFKGKEFMDLDFGTVPTIPSRYYYQERMEYLCGTDIDISRTDHGLLKISPDTKFDGNCQSTKYLEGYRNDILQWLTIKNQYKNTLGENACVIHIRFGDFANQKDVFLAASYYQHAMAHLKQINPEITFYCVTDEKEKAEKFLPGVEMIGSSQGNIEDMHKANHHLGGPIGTDFSLLMHASYLIIPNSSFSWWAAYLNTNKKITVAPKYWARHNISDGYWSTSDIITDDFTYLDREGNFSTAKECWEEKQAYESSHPGIFCAERTVSKKSLIQRIMKKLWKREK